MKTKFFAVCILLFLVNMAEATASKLYFLYTIDGFSEREPFKGLSAFFVNGEELLVADTVVSRIYIYDLEGTPLFQFGKEKGVKRPLDLIVLNERIYLIQEGKESIDILNMRGDRIGKTDTPFKGFIPIKLAREEGGGFVAVDKQSLRICLFDEQGKYLNCFGGRDLFKSMGGIAAREGRIYVASMDGAPVVKIFDVQGNYLTGFGKIGDGKESFSMPSGIYVDSHGTVWVADAFKHRVTGHTIAGKIQNKFGGFGTFSGSLNYPQGITGKGNLFFVLEKGRQRISVFKFVE